MSQYDSGSDSSSNAMYDGGEHWHTSSSYGGEAPTYELLVDGRLFYCHWGDYWVYNTYVEDWDYHNGIAHWDHARVLSEAEAKLYIATLEDFKDNL